MGPTQTGRRRDRINEARKAETQTQTPTQTSATAVAPLKSSTPCAAEIFRTPNADRTQTELKNFLSTRRSRPSASERQEGADAAPIVSVLVAELRDEVALLEGDADEEIGRRHRGEEQ